MLFLYGNSMNLLGISTVHMGPSSGGTLLETPNSKLPNRSLHLNLSVFKTKLILTIISLALQFCSLGFCSINTRHLSVHHPFKTIYWTPTTGTFLSSTFVTKIAITKLISSASWTQRSCTLQPSLSLGVVGILNFRQWDMSGSDASARAPSPMLFLSSTSWNDVPGQPYRLCVEDPPGSLNDCVEWILSTLSVCE